MTDLSGRWRCGVPLGMGILLSVITWVLTGTNTGAREEPTTTSPPFFRIAVVDAETGRGVPLVELRTTDSRLFVTDSAGVVAFFEPDLMGKPVFFALGSFGYSHPKNVFGQRGRVLNPTPCGTAVVEVQRHNIAQRLYRVTGSGIYRDSVLLGDDVPPTQDPTDVPATGMDSVQGVLYHGKMFWVWGDTSVSANSLGNFRATAATSELPGHGGLDPDVGVSLTYFRDGPRLKPMVNDEHMPIWLNALRTAQDEQGRERLVASYAKVTKGMRVVGKGLVEFNDNTAQFDIAVVYPGDAVMVPGGHPFPCRQGEVDYYYYPAPWPAVRSRRDVASIMDLSSYEAFTCLKQGCRFDGSAGQLDRDAEDDLVWRWRKNTSPMSKENMDELLKAGHMAQNEAWYRLLDVNTGDTVVPHAGSVYWNEHRQRWISIRCQMLGAASFLGEIWYFEGDTPLGPWVYGQKIVTHARRRDSGGDDGGETKKRDVYSFYNPKQHPEFDKDGGRVTYFEGTYTTAFSGNPFPTPYYNYNQVMYKLELDDARLFLPVPVYRVAGHPHLYRTKQRIPPGSEDVEVAFFAPDRPRDGTIPVYEVHDPGQDGMKLVAGRDAGELSGHPIAFYGIGPSTDVPASITKDLYEWRHLTEGRLYSTDELSPEEGYRRSNAPLCRVWVNPIRFNPLDMG